jgi:hypothetical protein
MSALGHKRTFCDAGAMSALPPQADIPQRGVSQVTPVATISAATARTARTPPRKFSLIGGPPLAVGHAFVADEKVR